MRPSEDEIVKLQFVVNAEVSIELYKHIVMLEKETGNSLDYAVNECVRQLIGHIAREAEYGKL